MNYSLSTSLTGIAPNSKTVRDMASVPTVSVSASQVGREKTAPPRGVPITATYWACVSRASAGATWVSLEWTALRRAV